MARVYQVGAYQSDFRLNAALAYQWQDNLVLSLFIQNLLGSHGNKRYAEDSGNNAAAPRRVRFTEEPCSVGLRLDYHF